MLLLPFLALKAAFLLTTLSCCRVPTTKHIPSKIPVASATQSHALLLQLGQQPDIAALASRYLYLCIPCLFLTTTMECIRKYLQSQRAVKPAMAVAAAVLAASPLFFWLFVEQCQMGLDGAAYAFIACQVTTLLGLLGYVVYRAWRLRGKREQTWGGWSGEAFKGWGEYCSYGLPAAAMIAGEWWAYEVGGWLAASTSVWGCSTWWSDVFAAGCHWVGLSDNQEALAPVSSQK